MSEEEQESERDAGYIEGERMALIGLLKHVLRELHCFDAPFDTEKQALIAVARLTAERQCAIAVLRRICRDHGDNDWEDNLYLPDIIEKHIHWDWDEES